MLLTGINSQLIERINLPRTLCRAMLKWLVTGFPPHPPGFTVTSDHVEFVVYTMELGQVFSEYFDFPRQFSFHRLFHNDEPFTAGKMDLLVTDAPSGLSHTPHHE
jgi:hypothetical protein